MEPRALSMKSSRQSTEGYTHGSRWIGGGARDMNQMVTETQDLYRFRPSAWRNTLHHVLCYFVLIVYQIRYPDPCLSLYTLEGYGYKENILFGIIQ